MALILGLGFVAGCKAPEKAPASSQQTLPDLGAVPEFALTDQRGASITLTALKGQPWVANTFFTSCRTICPALMGKVRELQKTVEALEPPVRFVSITVDPDNDTAEALAEYAQTQGFRGRWQFVTGDFDAIRQLVVEGFHTAMGTPEKDETGNVDITHSGKLFVVDRNGRIRGYFPADDEGVRDAARALEALSK